MSKDENIVETIKDKSIKDALEILRKSGSKNLILESEFPENLENVKLGILEKLIYLCKDCKKFKAQNCPMYPIIYDRQCYDIPCEDFEKGKNKGECE